MNRPAITLALLAAACAPREPAPLDGAAGAAAATPDSAQFAGARAALAAYLEASREGSPTRAALDTLARCDGDGGLYLPATMLAAYEVLSAEAQRDLVVGRATVTTVAEQDEDRRNPGRLVARQRVRTDTLEWDVMTVGDDGGWRVCNGLRFGYRLAADSLTRWLPVGASYASARALADSIAAARR
jgi:hypothetical protein